MKARIVIGALRCLSRIPFPLLYILSDVVAAVLYHIVRYRRKVVQENLVTSFPEKNPSEIRKISKRYYRFMCDTMVETVKLLTISPEVLKKRVDVTNPQIVDAELRQGTSTAILLGHYGNWEWVQEIGRYFTDNAFKGSIYHTMNNSLSEELFLSIRNRWKMHILPQAKAVRTLLNRDNLPWSIGFIADQRPRQADKDSWVEFLNHDTAFITGPEDIGTRVGAKFFYLDIERVKRGYYRLSFTQLQPEDDGSRYAHTRLFWKLFEKTIRRDPALWLWSHKRWKYGKNHKNQNS